MRGIYPHMATKSCERGRRSLPHEDGDDTLTLLRIHRKAAGLSLHKAAGILKVHISTVHAWESGANKPQPRMIPLIAELYRISPLDLAKLIELPLSRSHAS